MTSQTSCSCCKRELSGAEPEGLCPRCLLASAVLASGGKFALEDLPDDSCDSYRPERGQPLPTLIADASTRATGQASAATQYKLENQIGLGGSGEVWSAVQLSLGRSVAVKRLHFHATARDPVKAARRLEDFQREAVITGRLDHPNIVPVYDLGTDADGQPFLAMKLIEGTPWSEVLKHDASMPQEERLAKHLPILVEICRAVSFAHSRGVIHRDLKPSQVIIGQYGEVLLTDWGLAVTFRRLEDGIQLDGQNVPNPAGTVAFMAPEQTVSAADQLGPWTDVYLLGGILYYILTLTPPHNQQNTQEAFQHANTRLLEPPETRAPGLAIPPELSTLCMKAMEPEPAQRFAGVEGFSGELSRYLSSTASRNESTSLMLRAATMYSTATDSYTNLQACDKLLQAACEVWPANIEAAALQQKIVAHLVRLATSRGDLGMAEMQIQRLEEPAVADPLRAAIHKARLMQRRRVTHGRLLWSAVGLLAVAACLLGSYGWQTTVRNAAIEEKRRSEQQRAELLNTVNQLRSEETSLSEELTKQLPFPTKLLYRDEAFGVGREQQRAIDEMLSHSAPLAALRSDLLNQGVPLEPEPFALASARARLALHQSKTPPEALSAYALAMSAARARPAGYQGRLLLGIAAARAGFFTSATLHLKDASLLASRLFTPQDPEMRGMTTLFEQAFARSAAIIPPGAIVVESTGTRTRDGLYREILGKWFDSTSRSCAPGTHPSVPGRCCGLRDSATTHPAMARFAVPKTAPREAFVYATWGASANVSRASYAVHHSGGVTTTTVRQSGFGPADELPFRGNGNLWVPLGRYRFSSTTEDCIEVSAGAESGMPDIHNDQRLYADAVLFSPVPLEQATGANSDQRNPKVDAEVISQERTPASTQQIEEFLVETHPLGMNSDCYRELSGTWSAAPPSLFAKSQAAGVTTSFKCGGRRVQLPAGGEDATARFDLKLAAPQTLGVYVTWSRTANARPVIYRVRHADGDSEIILQQQGAVGGNDFYDHWIHLGTFKFAANSDQGVEIVVPANAHAAASGAPGIAYADAVLFSKTPPPSPIPWNATKE